MKYSIDPVDDAIDFSGKTRIKDRLCEFIEETVYYYETENYVFVHGCLPENVAEEIRKLLASYNELPSKTFEDIVAFHVAFAYVYLEITDKGESISKGKWVRL